MPPSLIFFASRHSQENKERDIIGVLAVLWCFFLSCPDFQQIFGKKKHEESEAKFMMNHERWGEKVLINGLVQAPHLNGHWGHVTDYDPEPWLQFVEPTIPWRKISKNTQSLRDKNQFNIMSFKMFVKWFESHSCSALFSSEARPSVATPCTFSGRRCCCTSGGKCWSCLSDLDQLHRDIPEISEDSLSMFKHI